MDAAMVQEIDEMGASSGVESTYGDFEIELRILKDIRSTLETLLHNAGWAISDLNIGDKSPEQFIFSAGVSKQKLDDLLGSFSLEIKRLNNVTAELRRIHGLWGAKEQAGGDTSAEGTIRS